jgi:general secretion pathway protein A
MSLVERYWGLARRPFANTPDPAFLVTAPAFEEAFARLVYDATEARGGLSLVTGDIGCGKTMLTHALADRLAGTPHAALLLATPRLTPAELLRTVLAGTGGTRPPRGRHALIEAVGAHLADIHAAGRRPVLVVDEAQLATPSLFEEVRLLTNFEDRHDKHLHVVLVGQPELRERVARLAQVDQRVGLRAHLDPLDAAEVAAYVAHRLAVAGGDAARILADGAVAALAERSGGVPRLVNNLAAQALFVAAARREPRVTAALVADVAEDRA